MTLQIKHCQLQLNLHDVEQTDVIEQQIKQLLAETLRSLELEELDEPDKPAAQNQQVVHLRHLNIELPAFELETVAEHFPLAFKTALQRELNEALQRSAVPVANGSNHPQHSHRSVHADSLSTQSDSQSMQWLQIKSQLLGTSLGLQTVEYDDVVKEPLSLGLLQALQPEIPEQKARLIEFKAWLRSATIRHRTLTNLDSQARASLITLVAPDLATLAQAVHDKGGDKDCWAKLFYLAASSHSAINLGRAENPPPNPATVTTQSMLYRCLKLQIDMGHFQIKMPGVGVANTVIEKTNGINNVAQWIHFKERIYAILDRPNSLLQSELQSLQRWIPRFGLSLNAWQGFSAQQLQQMATFEQLVLSIETRQGRISNDPDVTLEPKQERVRVNAPVNAAVSTTVNSQGSNTAGRDHSEHRPDRGELSNHQTDNGSFYTYQKEIVVAQNLLKALNTIFAKRDDIRDLIKQINKIRLTLNAPNVLYPALATAIRHWINHIQQHINPLPIEATLEQWESRVNEQLVSNVTLIFNGGGEAEQGNRDNKGNQDNSEALEEDVPKRSTLRPTENADKKPDPIGDELLDKQSIKNLLMHPQLPAKIGITIQHYLKQEGDISVASLSALSIELKSLIKQFNQTPPALRPLECSQQGKFPLLLECRCLLAMLKGIAQGGLTTQGVNDVTSLKLMGDVIRSISKRWLSVMSSSSENSSSLAESFEKTVLFDLYNGVLKQDVLTKRALNDICDALESRIATLALGISFAEHTEAAETELLNTTDSPTEAGPWPVTQTAKLSAVIRTGKNQNDSPKDFKANVYSLEKSIWRQLQQHMPEITQAITRATFESIADNKTTSQWLESLSKLVTQPLLSISDETPDRKTLYDLLATIHGLLSCLSLLKQKRREHNNVNSIVYDETVTHNDERPLKDKILAWQSTLEPEIGSIKPLKQSTWWQGFIQTLTSVVNGLCKQKPMPEVGFGTVNTLQKLGVEIIAAQSSTSTFSGTLNNKVKDVAKTLSNFELPKNEKKRLETNLADAEVYENEYWHTEELNRITQALEQQVTELKHLKSQAYEGLLASDAGLVLVWPFLKEWFIRETLLNEPGTGFINQSSQLKALTLLHYISGNPQNCDNEIPVGSPVVANLLVGLAPETVIDEALELNQKEKERAQAFLTMIIGHWKAIKNMPVNSFQSLFIQREANCYENDTGWRIDIDKTTTDILLSKLPWSIGVISLPWLQCEDGVQRLIHVNWDSGFNA
jgi:Contractile injection system tape measure protein